MLLPLGTLGIFSCGLPLLQLLLPLLQLLLLLPLPLPQAYFENRCKRIDEREAVDRSSCYPHKFQTDTTLKAFLDAHNDLEKGQSREDVEVCIAGRLMRKHEAGAKLVFYDLSTDGLQLQVFATAAYVQTIARIAAVARCTLYLRLTSS
jgi:lysyl-tRNA synthetase class II